MNTNKFYLLFFLLAVAFGCNNQIKSPSSSSPTFQLGEELILTTAPLRITSEDLEFKIEKVMDSRCPLKMNCFVAGEGKIFVTAKKGDIVQEKIITAKGLCHATDGSCGNLFVFEGYKIKLMSLAPYPGENEQKKIGLDEYQAKIIITKK